MSRRSLPRWLILAAILLLAAGLRFYCLACQSLWSDEGNSVALARAGFAEIARRTAFDIHPPLYYWLLKLWTALFGTGEAGVRSLSAALGAALVLASAGLGARRFGRRVGLLVALLSAVSPLQVYYAQETRMYTLLALLGAAAVWAGLEVMAGARPGRAADLIYVAAATAGLYTHYAFPVVLAAINLAAAAWLWAGRAEPAWGRRLGRWAALQAIPALLYAPWLPVAWRQIRTWPDLSEPAPAGQIALAVLRLLGFGLSLEPGQAVPLLLLGALLLAGAVQLARRRFEPGAVLLWLWLALPVALTFALYRPAYLKFLLVASPPFSLILALGLTPGRGRAPAATLLRAGALALLLFYSGRSLANYYFEPAYQRDNYRAIARFIEATGRPADAVILTAPGQQEVFDYYFRGELPVFPLPRSRPMQLDSTLGELAEVAAGPGNIYAVYWATAEADPDGVIEGWLADHAFKATDRWYGNVRLATYATPPPQTDFQPVEARFGEQLHLTGFSLPAGAITPGRILPVSLRWEAGAPLPDYVVFLQLLDENNHLVGQQDAPPRPPSSTWQPGQPVADAHGLYVEPGTPPGEHRLIAGVYDGVTGQRLRLAGGEADFVELARLRVEKPAAPLPPEALAIQARRDLRLGGVRWLGYDLYRVGHASDPAAPIHSGDPVHLVLYFRLEEAAPDLPDRLQLQVVTGAGGATAVERVAPLSGAGYSIREWSVGEIVRAQFDLFLTGLGPGSYRIALTLPGAAGGPPPARATTGPFRVVD